MSGPILACYRIGTEVISTDLALLPRIRASPDFRRAGALSLQLLLIAEKKKFILEEPRLLHLEKDFPQITSHHSYSNSSPATPTRA